MPDPMERDEIPHPVRSDAVESRFHCAGQQADRHDQHQRAMHTVLTMHTVLVVLM
jgi:hypothetical protein